MKNYTVHSAAIYGYAWSNTLKIVVNITVDAKAWHKLKKTGHLGQLYGVDVGNELSRNWGVDKSYIQPVVEDRKRARDGLKFIRMEYPLTRVQAEAYGWTADVGVRFERRTHLTLLQGGAA